MVPKPPACGGTYRLAYDVRASLLERAHAFSQIQRVKLRLRQRGYTSGVPVEEACSGGINCLPRWVSGLHIPPPVRVEPL